MATALSISVITLGVLGVYAAWLLHLHGTGVPVLPYVLLGVAAYGGLVLLVTLLWFALAWMWRADPPPDVRLDFRGRVRLVTQEWLALLGNGWRMGFGWWAMREPPPRPATAPVVLVHGVLCNSAVWLWMRSSLARRGVGPLYTISYGPPLASIDRFADQLARRIDAILRDTGAARVSLVGHSMGGLVARAYLRRYGDARVAQVITIGTPHAGSVHAWTFPGTSLAELRPGSAWLRALDAAPRPQVPVTSIWSWHDSMVAPQDSARLAWARNIAVAGIAHNALLRDVRIVDLVTTLLRETVVQARDRATSGCPGSAVQTPSAPA